MTRGALRLVVAAVLLSLTGCASSSPSELARNPAASASATEDSSSGSTAEENAKKGTTAWRGDDKTRADEMDLAGYTDPTLTPGQPIRLKVDSTLGAYTVTAYRIGYYGGAGAREVWRSEQIDAVDQPEFTIGDREQVRAGWKTTLTIPTDGWREGFYLLMLRAGGKWRYVPVVLRSTDSRERLVLVASTATWQAYNSWGGWSLYRGVKGADADKADRLSYDRPYQGNGAPKALEFDRPVFALAEKRGLRVAYLTSYDLERPGILAGATGIVSMGHDEYWTPGMRRAVEAARDSGTNLAFLGANASYWRVRFEDEGHTLVGYKSSAKAADPVHNRPETTSWWRARPHPNPENSLTGQLYECYPGEGAFVVGEPHFWGFSSAHVKKGDKFQGLTGTEIDRAYPIKGTPKTLEVAAHSPNTCGPTRNTHSDFTYYTAPSGAGVIAVGTMRWVMAVNGPVRRHGIDSAGHRFARNVTATVLAEMAKGPLGLSHPARPNLRKIHAEKSTRTGTGGPIGY